MNKFVDMRMVIVGFLISLDLLMLTYFSITSEVELLAQQQSNISIGRATALSSEFRGKSSESYNKLQHGK
jgi:hypothetical protein